MPLDVQNVLKELKKEKLFIWIPDDGREDIILGLGKLTKKEIKPEAFFGA